MSIMNRTVIIGAVVMAFGVSASAQPTLDLSIQATDIGGGQYIIDIVGMMGGAGHDGLALWSCNLETTAGDLDLDIDSMAAFGVMTAFDKDDGLTNPAGYGGTPSAGDLLQIGGGQNTIGNVAPPSYPTGTVITGVGNSAVVLATGTYTLPADQTGDIALTISGAFATALTPGGGPDVYEVIPIENITYSVPSIVLYGDDFGLQSIVSVKTHGEAGDFAIDVPLDGSGIECRGGGPTKLVLTFDGYPVCDGDCDPTDISVTSGTVTAVSVAGNDLIIELNGTDNGAWLTVGLPGINTGETVTLGVLLGDANGDEATNVADASFALANRGTVTEGLQRMDVNADGSVNVADASYILANRTSLP